MNPAIEHALVPIRGDAAGDGYAISAFLLVPSACPAGYNLLAVLSSPWLANAGVRRQSAHGKANGVKPSIE